MLILPLQNLSLSNKDFDNSRNEISSSGVSIDDIVEERNPKESIVSMEWQNLVESNYKILYNFFLNTKGTASFLVDCIPQIGFYRLLEGNAINITHNNAFVTIKIKIRLLYEIKDYGTYSDNGMLWDDMVTTWDGGQRWM